MAVSTVGSGKEYLTIQAWADAVAVLGGARDAECYGDVGNLTISSVTWNPTSARIYAAAGQQHALNLTGANFGSSANTIDSASGITIDGMRGGTLTFLPTPGASTTFAVKNSIFASITCAASISTPSTTSDFTVINCIASDEHGGILVDCYDNGIGDGAAINATIVNCYTNDQIHLIEQDGTGTSVVNATVENCIAGSYASDIVTGSLTTSNNLSADDTADDFGGTGHLVNKALADQVVAVASNWKLKSTADARDAGATVAAASPDAIGTVRPIGAAYDMGPHELIPEDGPLNRKLRCLIAFE